MALVAAIASAGCSDKCTTPVLTVEPRVAVCQSGAGRLVLEGTDFAQRARVRLIAGEEEFESTSVVVNDEGTRLEADMPVGLSPGVTYDVIVDNGSCNDDEPHMQVTAVSGAFIFLTDPNVVYNGINTQVTIYGTSLQQPLADDALEIMPSGTTEASVIEWSPVVDRPNRIQFLVPEGQAEGSYDLRLTDGMGCETQLADAFEVTASTSITIASVEPPFADVAVYTSIQILRDTSTGDAFAATPRVFLNPTNATAETPAIALESVSFVDGDTLNAVVPPGQPAGNYDLIVVNPDGAVGIASNAFTIQSAPPPLVESATPSSIAAANAQEVVVAGSHFSADATVELTCSDPVGATTTPTLTHTTPVCTDGDCATTLTIDGSTLAAGSVCLLRLTNGDGSYFDYSAIGVTNPALNINDPVVGSTMIEARRALVGLSGRATATSRFIYALGGDGGASMASAPFTSVEAAPVNLDGTLGAFRELSGSPMGTARAFAGGVTIGRYVYITGGFDGANILASAERAMILDPIEIPRIDVGDIVPDETVGLDAGSYVYRVSAVFDAANVDNPAGESLPSDELIVRLPVVQDRKLSVLITVDPPRDRLGALIPGVVGYRVYRSPTSGGVSGDAVLIGAIPSGSTTFLDDGSAVPGTERPLQVGSLGRFTALPAMGVGRMGHAVLAAPDPASPNTIYLYSVMGRDALPTLGPDTDGTTTGGYEFLAVTVAPNGHQVFGSAWTTGDTTAAVGRWQLGSWLVDSTVLAAAGASSYLYFGGGFDAADTSADDVDVALVQAGGQLDGFADASKDFGASRAGYGVAGANGSLFVFGGVGMAGGSPIAGATAAKFVDATTLTASSWNNEGLSMDPARYLMGTAIESAFIFFLGGQTASMTAAPEEASATTSFVIW